LRRSIKLSIAGKAAAVIMNNLFKFSCLSATCTALHDLHPDENAVDADVKVIVAFTGAASFLISSSLNLAPDGV
jgi:hypothetical protein